MWSSPEAVAVRNSRANDCWKFLASNVGEKLMIAWFDDLALGMRFRSSEKVITRDDIKRFAAEFDPQPYHLDEAAAQRTPLKGLAASGWHTAAIAMRLAVEVRPFGPHPLLGLGVDELRWLAPVRPGDALRLEGEVTHTIKNKAPGNCSGQMDSFQSTWRARVHVYSNRHRAASAGL